jgi:nitronate monooxygenase
MAELLHVVHRDEARWCAMLQRQVKALGAIPSSKVGAFYEKAVAIAPLGERVAFLNRGQGWVVRKLRDMLPRVAAEGLRNDLSDMCLAHEANIALANGVIGHAP